MSAQNEPLQLQLLMPADAAVVFMPNLILYLESKIQLQGMRRDTFEQISPTLVGPLTFSFVQLKTASAGRTWWSLISFTGYKFVFTTPVENSQEQIFQ